MNCTERVLKFADIPGRDACVVQTGVWSDPTAAGGVPDHREPL